jgi:hypothetical protein
LHGARVALRIFDATPRSAVHSIDIIEAGLVPEGYELSSIDATSDNARLLAGTARDVEGRTHGWLLRLHDTCSL